MTEAHAEQLIAVLTRIANALDKTSVPAMETPALVEPGKPRFTDAPKHATGTEKPSYGRCKYCKAEIIWEDTPVGWRPYDPTSPFPLHLCKKRAAQDTADLLPGDPNTKQEEYGNRHTRRTRARRAEALAPSTH